jgi:hypothetical protein
MTPSKYEKALKASPPNRPVARVKQLYKICPPIGATVVMMREMMMMRKMQKKF